MAEGRDTSSGELSPASAAKWAVAYFAAHLLGVTFADPVRRVAAVWPASGVALAALLSVPRRRWPHVVAVLASVALATNLVIYRAPAMTVGFLVANFSETVLAALVLTRVSRRQVTFTRVDEVLGLGVVAVAVNALTAMLGATGPALFEHAPFWPSFRTWWISNLLGLVIVTPLIIVWTRRPPPPAEPATGRFETGAFAIAWCIGTWVTTRASMIAGPLEPRPYMLVCLLPWAALRLGLRTVTISMVVLGVLVISGARSGAILEFEGGSLADDLMRMQLYLALSGIMGILLGASSCEARLARVAADRSADRLTFALEAARMGIWEWDVPTNRIHWSDEVQRIFGFTPGEFSGTYEEYLALIHPDDRSTLAGVVQHALEPGGGNYAVEHRITWRDGAVRWVECRGHVDRDARGQPLRMAGTVVDATEKHQVAEHLRQTQKMEEIGQLAGGIAHDFNNLLSVILMQAEIARKSGALAGAGASVLEEIVTAAERGSALTKQLLAFARRQVLQPKPLDLNALVSNVATMLGRLLGEDVRMRVELSAGPLVTRADPGMLDQVMINLAVNARDAMPAGGELTIATLERTIEREGPDGAAPGTYAAVRLSDTGAGIPAEHMHRVFEPFFTTKPPGKGTGLGLPMVFGILRLHHGFIRVTSEVGRGSTFEVLLPLSAEAVEPDEPPARPPSAPQVKRTILLVEDNDGVRRTTRMLLEMHDFEVLEAKDGVDALRVWDEQGHRIDLVFTDLTMPGGLDGRQLAAELRRRRPDLEVILTSGYSAPGADATEGERFLMKPSTLPELLDAVTGALRSRHRT